MGKLIEFLDDDEVNGIKYKKGDRLKVSSSIFENKINILKTAKEIPEDLSDEIENVDNEEFEGEEGINAHKTTVFDDTIYPANIKFLTAHYSIFELKRQYEDRKQIELAPPYQRELVWKPKQKSELIESILMGIPLPLMYFFEDSHGIFQVVDGKQRLNALFAFLNNEFSLTDLTILKDLKGKRFKHLEARLQAKLEDYKLLINIIQYPTPDRVKFDIFDRVNRGGTRLNNQEMRNAIYHGKSTELLEKLKQNSYFLKATDKAINTNVMKDRYVILRMIAFYLWQQDRLIDIYTGQLLDYKSDIDDFLGKTMSLINKMENSEVSELEEVFESSMKNCYKVLGKNSFRVSTYTESYQKRPINMALFEILAFMMTYNFKDNQKNKIRDNIETLFDNDDFTDSITSPVDSSVKVNKRFNFIKEFVKDILND